MNRKIVIVTGASSGMGREFALSLDAAIHPDELWVIARRSDRLQALSEHCQTPVVPLSLDLTECASLDALKEKLAAEKPQIAVLCNAAGYGLFGAFSDLPAQEQLGEIALNVQALTAICRACLPYMSSGSSIINLGSNSSWQPVPYMAVYAASKAYVLSFSRALGRELKPKGIHVMCVCPHWVKTEFFDRAVRDDTVSYYDRFYTAEQVVRRAMRDLAKKRTVSVCGLTVRLQVLLVKLIPAAWVMNIWCKQQKKL